MVEINKHRVGQSTGIPLSLLFSVVCEELMLIRVSAEARLPSPPSLLMLDGFIRLTFPFPFLPLSETEVIEKKEC